MPKKPEKSLKRVKFPIERTVVCGGKEERKKLHLGTVLKCWRCGEIFFLSHEDCYHLKPNQKGFPDEGPYIRCPECFHGTHCIHYIDNPYRAPVVIPKPKHKHSLASSFYETSLDYEY